MEANDSNHEMQPRKAGQWVNLRAVQWAYEQDDLSVTAKATLMTFALHANDRGYSWPGVDYIASRWGMDRETVRRQIDILLVRRLLHRTKKRRGATGQVKVYRLPEITYESGGKCCPFEKSESSGQARNKRGIRCGKSTPNIGIRNSENDHERAVAILNFIDAIKHPQWPQFVAYCKSRNGTPTLKGFLTWLKSHPQRQRTQTATKNRTSRTNPRYEAVLRASQERFDAEHGITVGKDKLTAVNDDKPEKGMDERH